MILILTFLFAESSDDKCSQAFFNSYEMAEIDLLKLLDTLDFPLEIMLKISNTSVVKVSFVTKTEHSYLLNPLANQLHEPMVEQYPNSIVSHTITFA